MKPKTFRGLVTEALFVADCALMTHDKIKHQVIYESLCMVIKLFRLTSSLRKTGSLGSLL